MKIILVIALAFFSYTVLGQTADVKPVPTIAPTASVCTERGLKCCNKARGKRAIKIISKCEKKYKCVCPKPTAKKTLHHWKIC